MEKYIISPITVYCPWNMLWETKIAYNSQGMPLHYSVWGLSEEISKERARLLVSRLEGERGVMRFDNNIKYLTTYP